MYNFKTSIDHFYSTIITVMPNSFIPYSRQHITDDDIKAVEQVLRSEFLTQGPVVTAFEDAFAAAHAVDHAIAVSNATSALHISCLALGVGPGDIVWTSPNSFLASANCALYCGADVDFVDIDADTRNMSISELTAKLAAADAAGRLPKVLIPVDFAGLPADLREMRFLADHYGFSILEDASHATGASYLGQPVGSSWADICVFSFHPVKVVTSGEGGMITTQNANLAEKLKLLRSHGMTRDPAQMNQVPEGPWVYEQRTLGYNMRMTDLQAALGNSQLKRLDAMHAARSRLAGRYFQQLADLPLRLPASVEDRVSAWHLFPVEIDAQRTSVSRSKVFESLRASGIGVNVHYIPIHTQPVYRNRGFSVGDFPVAEGYYARAMSLPLFPTLTDSEQDRVIMALRQELLF